MALLDGGGEDEEGCSDEEGAANQGRTDSMPNFQRDRAKVREDRKREQDTEDVRDVELGLVHRELAAARRELAEAVSREAAVAKATLLRERATAKMHAKQIAELEKRQRATEEKYARDMAMNEQISNAAAKLLASQNNQLERHRKTADHLREVGVKVAGRLHERLCFEVLQLCFLAWRGFREMSRALLHLTYQQAEFLQLRAQASSLIVEAWLSWEALMAEARAKCSQCLLASWSRWKARTAANLWLRLVVWHAWTWISCSTRFMPCREALDSHRAVLSVWITDEADEVVWWLVFALWRTWVVAVTMQALRSRIIKAIEYNYRLQSRSAFFVFWTSWSLCVVRQFKSQCLVSKEFNSRLVSQRISYHYFLKWIDKWERSWRARQASWVLDRLSLAKEARLFEWLARFAFNTWVAELMEAPASHVARRVIPNKFLREKAGNPLPRTEPSGAVQLDNRRFARRLKDCRAALTVVRSRRWRLFCDLRGFLETALLWADELRGALQHLLEHAAKKGLRPFEYNKYEEETWAPLAEVLRIEDEAFRLEQQMEDLCSQRTALSNDLFRATALALRLHIETHDSLKGKRVVELLEVELGDLRADECSLVETSDRLVARLEVPGKELRTLMETRLNFELRAGPVAMETIREEGKAIDSAEARAGCVLRAIAAGIGRFRADANSVLEYLDNSTMLGEIGGGRWRFADAAHSTTCGFHDGRGPPPLIKPRLVATARRPEEAGSPGVSSLADSEAEGSDYAG